MRYAGPARPSVLSSPFRRLGGDADGGGDAGASGGLSDATIVAIFSQMIGPRDSYAAVMRASAGIRRACGISDWRRVSADAMQQCLAHWCARHDCRRGEAGAVETPSGAPPPDEPDEPSTPAMGDLGVDPSTLLMAGAFVLVLWLLWRR